MANYTLRFNISCDYGRFGYNFSISPEVWSTHRSQSDIIWEGAEQAIASCFRPEWQDVFYHRRIKREMEFVVTVEPLFDGSLGTNRRDAEKQPDSLKRFWNAKQTFVVLTALHVEKIKPKGAS